MTENIEKENNEVPHVNVVICTPGHSLMGAYVKSLLSTVHVLNQKGITWAFSNEYSSHVGDAREMTVNGGNQNEVFNTKPFRGTITYDKLFWIDSDIKWEPEQFMKLYESDKDIISGAYLLSTGEVTAYKEPLGRPYMYEEVVSLTEPEVVHSVGFGFICVKNGVFENIKRPWFQATEITTKVGEMDFTFNIMGEDIAWCEKVNNLGYQIWFDPTVRVTHHKTVQLTWEGIKP